MQKSTQKTDLRKRLSKDWSKSSFCWNYTIPEWLKAREIKQIRKKSVESFPWKRM